MKKLFAILALTILAMSANAQALKVATGGTGGTYSRMFKEVSGACSTQLPLSESTSSGSVQNIDRILGNEVNAAFVQADVLHWRARTEDLGNIKTLMTLHPEAVHLVAMADSKIKTGGTLGTAIGAKPVVFSTLTDLAGYTVGAAGGSVVTANVIRMQSEVQYNIAEFPSNDALLAALTAGQVQAALLVGGAPLGAPVAEGAKPTLVAALNRNYKLLSISETLQGKLKNVYSPVVLNYSNMGMTGVKSVSTEAIFVTREYKTPKVVDGLSKLRACAIAAVPELAETIGMHPMWSKVNVESKGKWTYYKLPEADAPAVAKKK